MSKEIILVGVILIIFAISEIAIWRFFEKRRVKRDKQFEVETKDCKARINASFQNIHKTLKEYFNDL